MAEGGEALSLVDWAGIVGGVTGVLSLAVAWFVPSPRDVAEDLGEDPTYRSEIAAKLRSASVGAVYRDMLAAGLAFLERRMGAPGSAKALGVSIVLAIVYAWATFALPWGLGAPGTVGGFVLLAEAPQPSRAITGVVIVVWPPIFYYCVIALDRCIDQIARSFRIRMLRRVKKHVRRFKYNCLNFAYRLLSGTVRIAAIGVNITLKILIVVLLLTATVITLDKSKIMSENARLPFTAFAAAAIYFLMVKITTYQQAQLEKSYTISRLMEGVFAISLMAVSIGLTSDDGLLNAIVLILLLFFLVLPVVNGFWDWLSWMATRRLGAHLLRHLGQGVSWRERAIAVLGHGLLDLAAAVALMLSMAFVLALGFEVYNELAIRQRGQPVFALGPFIDAAAADPLLTGFWLTAMLGTTLVPTFLHVGILIASPLALAFLPDARRLELAAGLEGYDALPEDKQAAVRRKTAWWLTRARVGTWTVAGLLFLAVLALFFGGIRLLHQGGFADWVRDAAYAGIWCGQWLGWAVLGNPWPNP